MKKHLTLSIAFLICFISFKSIADDKITVEKVKGNVYMLSGSGGNIGVLATSKGLLLVDDKYAPLAEKIEQAMKTISGEELKYVVNTHYHGDHTGANEHFAKHAPIIAHKNVRKRLNDNAKVSKQALPVVTYDDGINIFLDDEQIILTHLPSGHTDSDTYVYFKNANVLHTGDLFFEGRFPYIDLNGGGTVKGYLANVHYLINNTPKDATIIPGHGNLTNVEGLKAFAKMLEYSIERVSSALNQGKSEEQILAMGIGQQYENLTWNFITEEKWLKTLINGLK